MAESPDDPEDPRSPFALAGVLAVSGLEPERVDLTAEIHLDPRPQARLDFRSPPRGHAPEELRQHSFDRREHVGIIVVAEARDEVEERRERRAPRSGQGPLIADEADAFEG